MGSRQGIELLAYLPQPAAEDREQAFKLFQDKLLAYPSGSTVVIVDIHTLSNVNVLVGGHVNSVVTAVDWYPIGHGEESSGPLPLLIASADALGRAVVWDALSGEAIAVLGDAGAAYGMSHGKTKLGITAVSWVTSSNILAVLLEHGKLLLWDCKNGNIVHKKDLGGDEYWSMMSHPHDLRQLVLGANEGIFSSLRVDSLDSQKIEFKRFQASISAGSTLKCWIPGIEDVVMLLLEREIIFFDLIFGSSVGSILLPAAMPKFERIVGTFGHSTANRSLYECGIDVLLCCHVDNSLSTWSRDGTKLRYKMISHYPLVTPEFKSLATIGKSERGSGSGKPFLFMGACAGAKTNISEYCIDVSKRPWYPSSIFLLGIPADGSVWKWEIDGSGLSPLLVSMYSSVTSPVSSLCSFPRNVLIGSDGYISSLLAVGTATGNLELYSVARGRAGNRKRLELNLAKCFSVADRVRIQGIQWLGDSGKISYYTSVDTRDGGGEKGNLYKNTAHVVDFRTGERTEFRNAVETGKIISMKASPRGSYVLIVLSGVPSEIWAMDSDAITRLRHVDLDFSSVEWLPQGFGLPQAEMDSESSNKNHLICLREMSGVSSEGAAIVDPAEEMLSFSLLDGRLGILLVKGRKIQDARPKSPNWAPLVTGEFQTTCACATGSFIFLGGSDGTLARWDTRTGDTIAVETGCAAISQVIVAQEEASGASKLAILSTSGTFAVLVADRYGKFTSTKITWTSGYSRVGFVSNLEWIPVPNSQGIQSQALMLHLREGSIAVIDTQSPEVKLQNQEALPSYQLIPPRALPCTMLLPRSWRELICILIQAGIPEKYLNSEQSSLEDIEDAIWNILPGDCLQYVMDQKAQGSNRRLSMSPSKGVRSIDSPIESVPQGALAELLISSTGENPISTPSSPLHPREGQDSEDKAAYQLGYRPQSSGRGLSEVSEALKSIRGSVKDIAMAGRERMQKTIGHQDRIHRSVSGSYSNPQPGTPTFITMSGSRTLSVGENDSASFRSLAEVLLASQEVQGLESYPFGPLEVALFQYANQQLMGVQEGKQNDRKSVLMALSSRIRWSLDEERFWLELPTFLSGSSAEECHPSIRSNFGSIWYPKVQINILSEQSTWHAEVVQSNTENSEELEERIVLEQICLGDMETAVSMLLATPPGTTSRFYRDAMCSLGMAYACAAERMNMDENSLASSLFVQAARVIAMNAATAGDSLVGVPLLYSTSKYDDAVEILQKNSMWTYAATLAANKLSPSQRRVCLDKYAQHLARRRGMIWHAIGVLAGSYQFESAIDMMLQYNMYDRAQGLIDVLDESGLSDSISQEVRSNVQAQFTKAINNLIAGLVI